MNYVLLDTSFLWDTPFDHGDFQKLLLRSKAGTLKICVPFIAWEERRTQLLEALCSKVSRAREAFDTATNGDSTKMFVETLPYPSLSIWSTSELDLKSREAMANFAAVNRIEVLEIGPDHSARAWERYFGTKAPFNPAETREKRRRDIPDSWILEAATDLRRRDGNFFALCRDGRLSEALKEIAFEVYQDAQVLLDTIDLPAVLPPPALPEVPPQSAQAETSPLARTLADAQSGFSGLDSRVLGFVAYFSGPPKDKLFDLLGKAGLRSDIAKNIADRLVLSGLLEDTGNHYLPTNREAAALASAAVESEVIRLLES